MSDPAPKDGIVVPITRIQISKRKRFEIFKRDCFACQYCGATPPKAVLHVDHIVAVAEGGPNDDDNLTTSCADCNLGKGARSLLSVPQSLRDKALDVAEREEQLRGYHEILEARRDRIEDELWRVAEVIEPSSTKEGMSRKWTTSIRMFNERLGVYVSLEAAEIARGRYPFGGKRTFLYYCGICWNRIKEAEGGART